ncbi:hypothetical protein [Sphingobium sp. CFD-1]|uniref:hypothetical protein n=1 Tax=Sphingobium sp. CFD-1 TaxID=2878545 RepID=UPI00214AF9F9|nr:hypothetical protein [Sphingobium sp. CFD-1]
MSELGKFWAFAPDRFSIELISNGKITISHCFDIAGVASSILATPTMTSLGNPSGFRGFSMRA